jgi:hypothetical protein
MKKHLPIYLSLYLFVLSPLELRQISELTALKKMSHGTV